MKGVVSWMGEGAEEELSRVVGCEASGMVGFVAEWMEVEREGWVGEKGVTKGMFGVNGGFKGMKNVLGGKVGVGMDMGGIVLHKGLGGTEGREVMRKGTTSTVTRSDMVFEVGGNRESTLKCKAVCTGAGGRWVGLEIMTCTKSASRVSAVWEAGRGCGGCNGGRVWRCRGTGRGEWWRSRRWCGDGGGMGMKELVDFSLEGKGFFGYCREYT